MNKSEQIDMLSAALAKAQGEMIGAKAENENPFFKSSYADLGSVWSAIRLPLSKNGLSVVQTTEGTTEGNVTLITTLCHSSGQWISGTYPVRPVKQDPQGMGSALTYARRYSLSAIVGVAPYDDDGESAMNRAPKAGVRPQQPSNDDGIQPGPAEYLIPTGRFAQKKPADCDPVALEDLIEEIKEKYQGKIIPGAAARFIKECSPIVAEYRSSFPGQS